MGNGIEMVARLLSNALQLQIPHHDTATCAKAAVNAIAFAKGPAMQLIAHAVLEMLNVDTVAALVQSDPTLNATSGWGITM